MTKNGYNNSQNSSNNLHKTKKPWGIRKKIIVVLIIVIIILSIVGVYYSYYIFPPRIEKISYEFIKSDEGTYVLFKVKVSGSLLFHERQLGHDFQSYFEYVRGGGGNTWDIENLNGEYQEKLGPFPDGTEIWFIAYVTSGNSYHWRDITVRINKPLATNQDKNLSIDGIYYTPRVLKIGERINISVDMGGTIDNQTVRTQVNKLTQSILSYETDSNERYTTGGGGGGQLFKSFNYTFSIGESSSYGWTSYSGILMFRVWAHDTNRTVVSKTHILKIED